MPSSGPALAWSCFLLGLLNPVFALSWICFLLGLPSPTSLLGPALSWSCPLLGFSPSWACPLLDLVSHESALSWGSAMSRVCPSLPLACLSILTPGLQSVTYLRSVSHKPPCQIFYVDAVLCLHEAALTE